MFTLNNVGRKFFKTNFKNFTKLNLVMPNLKNISLNINEQSTFADIEKELKNMKYFERIEFRTWDHCGISRGNDLETFFENNNMFFYRYDQLEWQIVSKQNIESLKHYEKVENLMKIDEFEKIKKLITNYNDNKNLTKEQFFEICLKIYRIRNLNELKDNTNFVNLFNEYYILKSEFAKLNNLNDIYLQRAGNWARLLLLFAGLFFVIELGLIYYGTFVLYTWDITEPMTYLLGCFNIVLLLALRKKFGNFSAFEYYTKKFYNRIINKNKFNYLLLEENKLKIKEIEKIIN
jgi:hypothetical protein